jgi:hypothetical protein
LGFGFGFGFGFVLVLVLGSGIIMHYRAILANGSIDGMHGSSLTVRSLEIIVGLSYCSFLPFLFFPGILSL